MSMKVRVIQFAGIGEAPSDDLYYARRNKQWTEVTTSGGSGLSVFRRTFDNDDLDASFFLTLDHPLGRMPSSILLYDDNGYVKGADIRATTTQLIVDLFSPLPLNSTWSIVASSSGSSSLYPFDNGDLDPSYNLSMPHPLGNLPSSIILYDDNGYVKGADIRATTTHVLVNLAAPISGTWTLGIA